MSLVKRKEVPIVKILLVDDHWMVRDGLKHMLHAQRKLFQFDIAEAENGPQAIEAILSDDFDLAILDYQMPGMEGGEVARKMLANKPGIKILALSNYGELSNIEKMIAAGARGYILKNIEPAEFLKAIQTVLAGKVYYSNEVYNRLLDSSRKNRNKEMIALTDRELEVLRWVALGKTSSQIAEALSVEKSTIDSHRNHLLIKLNVKNTASLLKKAYELKLIT